MAGAGRSGAEDAPVRVPVRWAINGSHFAGRFSRVACLAGDCVHCFGSEIAARFDMNRRSDFCVNDRVPAQVAELADALASGASGVTPVEVRVLSWALVRKGRCKSGLFLARCTRQVWRGPLCVFFSALASSAVSITTATSAGRRDRSKRRSFIQRMHPLCSAASACDTQSRASLASFSIFMGTPAAPLPCPVAPKRS